MTAALRRALLVAIRRRCANVGGLRLAGALAAVVACSGPAPHGPEAVTLRFWAFGREGEVVQALMPEFERTHPGVHVRVQQIPFTAAHEKLLTAVVGEATPDVAQLGNTWLPELTALGALTPLDSSIGQSKAIVRDDYFAGIWDTNVVGGVTYGVPWYVDTRVLFYRTDLLADAGYPGPPTTWSAWRDALVRVRARSGGRRYGVLLPVNEWAQPTILGLAAGALLLRDGGRYGDFADPRFRAAFAFYVGLFQERLAPPVSNVQIANLYQSFANGDMAMFISGPWDIGECLRRLPPALRGRWGTAPMPAPDGVGADSAERGTMGPGAGVPGTSLAGGSSLVLFRRSPHAAAAWALIAYLSDPTRQVAFYRLTEDLPARRSAWRDTAIANNRYVDAFWQQLQHVRATPKVPEWDQIATLLTDHAEAAIRGAETVDGALAALDRDVDQALEKRRWMLARGRIATLASP